MDTILLLHGYGVRSYFWDRLRPELSKRFSTVVAPDIDADSFGSYVEEVERLALVQQPPVSLVGHSLGALVAAAAALRLGADVVSHAVLLAPPGSSSERMGPVMRFLLRNQLIPQFLVRPRFFEQTPVAVQKRIFDRAVVESPALQDDIYVRRAELVEGLHGPMPQPALVVCSDADRIVPAGQSASLAERLGAGLHRFSAEDRIGHDDYAAAPAAVLEVARIVSGFCLGWNSPERDRPPWSRE